MEYYLATKRNEVLICATMWIDLEKMVNERSQSQNPHILWFHLYEMSRIGKSLGTKCILAVVRHWQEGDIMEWLLVGQGLFWGWWNCSKNYIMVMIVHSQCTIYIVHCVFCKYTEITELNTLKGKFYCIQIISQR